jgi:phage baseplate assembly protein W
MTTYNFKSSGKTQAQRIIEQVNASLAPVGIKTPMRLGSSEGIFEMTYSLADQVGDNLRNLLMTNRGERLGLGDFGADLRPLMSEFTTQEDFDTAAVERIKAAVSRWMPYVDLYEFMSEIDRNNNKNTAVVNLTVTYNVPALGLKDRKIQVVLYAM